MQPQPPSALGAPRPGEKHAPSLIRTAGRVLALAGLAGGGLLGGCASPITPRGSEELRQSVLDSIGREIKELEAGQPARTLTRDSQMGNLGIREEHMPELLAMAGPKSYDPAKLDPGPNLMGDQSKTVSVSLQRAIRSTVENNLALKFARLAPSVSRTQVTAAEAAFDWRFTSNLTRSNVDQPRTRQRFGSTISGVESDTREVTEVNAGLRRRLASGGQLSLEQEFTYSDVRTPGLTTDPNPGKEAVLTLQLDQPLLRGFGSDFSLAEIRLARNTERESIASLKRDLITRVTEAEQAYWELVRAHRDLMIQQRLLERGLETRTQVRERVNIDATQAQISDANARVEARKGSILRAQLALNAASDRLKLLMNDDDLTLGSGVLLLPADEVVDEAISYSVRDALLTALAKRPEIQQALISLENTGIRMQQANNARMPQLDLRLQARLAGLQDDFRGAYNDLADGQFIDYVLGLAFEYPIGNREAESVVRRRRLEQMQASFAYEDAVQQVAAEIVQALRAVDTSFRLIEQARVSRLAESENLRAFTVDKELRSGKTVERLSEEFRRQESLAQAEREELAALVDYGNSLAALSAAMGVALERNQIAFVVPDAPDRE